MGIKILDLYLEKIKSHPISTISITILTIVTLVVLVIIKMILNDLSDINKIPDIYREPDIKYRQVYLEDIKSSKYLIVQSDSQNKIYEPNAKTIIKVVNDAGYTLKTQTMNEFYSLGNYLETVDSYNLYSSTWNKHIQVKANKYAEELVNNFPEKKAEGDNWGVEYTVKTEKYSVIYYNVGFQESGYLSIVEVYDNKKNSLKRFSLLDLQTLGGIDIENESIHILAKKMDSTESVLRTYNAETLDLVSENILSKSFEYSSFSQRLGIKVISGNLNYFYDEDGSLYFSTYNISSGEKIINDVSKYFPVDSQFCVAFDFYDNRYYCLYDNGIVRVFDLKINLINEYKLNIGEYSFVRFGLNEGLIKKFIHNKTGYATAISDIAGVKILNFNLDNGELISTTYLNQDFEADLSTILIVPQK